ncbi:MAG TPA: NAD-dependent epimerase/dehydratase family protein [Ktedonobacterales bacterium]|nr:NAD-dependent epimerase/dehydratase family protein [Ktedonobacterales bacterium]
MTVFVTGASGHLGLTLVQQLLAEGRAVRTLERYRTPYTANLPIEFVPGDLGKVDTLHGAFAGVETVYHTAAMISLDANAWPALRAINVEGTRNVVALCQQHGVRRLLHVSSLEVFQTHPLNQPLDESRPLIAESFPLPYPRSKVISQGIVQQAMAAGLDAVVVFPSGMLGPNDHKLSASNAYILQLARGELPGLISGGYDWVDVRDVAAAMLRAERTAPAGATYILSGQFAPLRTIANLVEAAGGHRAPRLTFPAWLAYLGIGPSAFVARLQGKKSLFTRQSLDSVYTSNHHILHDHATADLGYAPRPLAETVTDTVRWLEEIGRFSPKRQRAAR